MKIAKPINKTLYKKRIELKYSLKEAAFLLGVPRLYLFLIEKGYLNVFKRYQNAFITAYKLKDNFFIINSTYPVPIDKDIEEKRKSFKLKKVLAKKRNKIIGFIALGVSLGAVAFGVYGINRRFMTPRLPWSETYCKFNDRMKKVGTKTHSALDNDDIYTVSLDKQISTSTGVSYEHETAINLYNKETSAENTNIESSIKKYIVEPYDNPVETFNFYLFSYNKKKLIFITYFNKSENINCIATSVIDNGEISLREFDYTKDGKSYKAKVGSEAYTLLLDSCKAALPYAFRDVNELFTKYGLYYSDGEQLLVDLQAISRDYTLFNRLGFSFIVCFSLTASVSLILLILSFYFSHELNPNKKEVEEYPIPIISRDIPIRGIVNDIKYPSIFPEFLLRATGLIILALSSITLFASFYLIYNGNFAGFTDANAIRSMTSNFLVSAILLLFFIKLDVYARKSLKSLLFNILVLFVGGLVFYISEILVYRAVLVEGDIFSKLLQVFTQVIPGNVIWNIMFYSLIFFFLFTLPKKYEGKPAKILKWRLFSLIPTFLLLFSLFYKIYLEDIIPSAYYFSFIFHTSGVITTLFAIAYIYSLYFLNFHNTLLLGEKNAKTYSYSKRFALEKNIIASIIILILFAIDMFFKYKAPSNPLKLGKSWSIILLIPFILLYRPHIGKRNTTWDNIYVTLYAVTFTGGYVASALYVLSKVNLADIMFILF